MTSTRSVLELGYERNEMKTKGLKMTKQEFKMHFPQLPFYLSVYKVVDVEKDLVTVLVRSTVHVNKEAKLATQYSLEFARDKPSYVEGDALAAIVRMYGLKLNPVTYS